MPFSQFDQQHYQREEQERDRILARYFGVASLRGDNRRLVREFLIGAAWWAVATPAMFYARFGVVDWFAISFTIFLVVLHLLFALGLWFWTKTEYHTPVQLKGGMADRIGAFWLVACGLGPFFGWLCTAILFTEISWRWQYLARAFLAVVLPVITAVPLVPYARGKAALIAVPLLVFVTALPISSCLWVLSDLHDGEQSLRVEVLPDDEGQAHCRSDNEGDDDLPCEEIRPALVGDRFQVIWLPHTGRVLTKQKLMH